MNTETYYDWDGEVCELCGTNEELHYSSFLNVPIMCGQCRTEVNVIEREVYDLREERKESNK